MGSSRPKRETWRQFRSFAEENVLLISVLTVVFVLTDLCVVLLHPCFSDSDHVDVPFGNSIAWDPPSAAFARVLTDSVQSHVTDDGQWMLFHGAILFHSTLSSPVPPLLPVTETATTSRMLWILALKHSHVESMCPVGLTVTDLETAREVSSGCSVQAFGEHHDKPHEPVFIRCPLYHLHSVNSDADDDKSEESDESNITRPGARGAGGGVQLEYVIAGAEGPEKWSFPVRILRPARFGLISTAVSVASSFGTLNCAVVSQWTSYMLDVLRIDRLMFYSITPEPQCLSQLTQLQHKEESRIEWYYFPQLRNDSDTWYFGQTVVINDAFLRVANSATYYGHFDIDEFLVLPPSASSLGSYLDSTLAQQSSYAGVSFGSVNKDYDVCVEQSWSRIGSQAWLRDIHAQSAKTDAGAEAECVSKAYPRDACPTKYGRRKFMVRTANVEFIHIHKIGPQRLVKDLSVAASNAYILHYRGLAVTHDHKKCASTR
eukprot:ANDGO_01890.mRNA.1 hypothetical protein